MKVAVTGASGFVGSMLVPALLAQGCELVLVGRDTDRLTDQFPNVVTCTYDTLEQTLVGVEVVVHLAAINNNQAVSGTEFLAVNRDLMLSIATKARAASVKRFIFVSSVHALDERNETDYASSKREAAKALTSIGWDATQIVYLPLVYGASWSGKFRILNRWPKPLAAGAFYFLSAMKPVCHISHLVEFVVAGATKTETVLADSIDLNWAYSSLKRISDLMFCAVVIIILGWAMALIWLTVKLSSPGPGIFSQERVGKHGKTFTLYKFRSMRLGTRQAGTHEISVDEVTRLGRFIRGTKVDELPQILNILKNEMSLVGPRPCLPTQTELVCMRQLAGVFSIKPGISGYAQIQGLDMTDPEKLVASEARYLKLRSMSLDLKIILATARGGGQGDKTSSST